MASARPSAGQERGHAPSHPQTAHTNPQGDVGVEQIQVSRDKHEQVQLLRPPGDACGAVTYPRRAREEGARGDPAPQRPGALTSAYLYKIL